MVRNIHVLCWTLCLLAGSTANAQLKNGSSARNQLNNNFGRGTPEVGDPVPDITVFDADGKKFPLRKIKGNYTVLVFGCLT
jgi:cytochrome oxidase Cu insertion factor (SCO1/SenC/PrrC family)